MRHPDDLGWGEGLTGLYKGRFSDDGNTMTGEWVYPGGGRYASTATRVEEADGSTRRPSLATLVKGRLPTTNPGPT